MSTSAIARHLYSLLGVAAMLALWQAAAYLPALQGVVPAPAQVARAVFADEADRRLFAQALAFTAGNALRGYLIGIAVGVALAVLALLVPRLRRGVVRFGALVNATPVIALGPVLLATVQRESLPSAVAAFFVFFAVFVAVLTGFAQAKPAHHDVFSVLGASRQQRFARLELPASLPALAAGLKVAAPAAVVGTIFGEWFGLDRGLGPLLISSMQGYQIAHLWGGTLLAGGLGLSVYLLLSLLENAVIRRFR